MSGHFAIGSEPTTDVLPGAHVAVVVEGADFINAGLRGRQLGLELRDTITVLRCGRPSAFVLLFRRPLAESTTTGQVLATGTGALNIDACRIRADQSEFFSATGQPRSGAGHARGFGMEGTFGGLAANPPHEGGRWPPNLVIVHGHECRHVGSKKVKGSNDTTGVWGQAGPSEGVYGTWTGHPKEARAGYTAPDGTETVDAWECPNDCPARELDQQSGESKSSNHCRHNTAEGHEGTRSMGTASPLGWIGQGHADSGGASRFFPQFPDEAGLREWLTRLLDPQA